MKIFNQLKEHFRKKTPEQVFSFCLFVGCISLMIFCAIVRLCGGLWFTADTSKIKEPSKVWQDIIMGALMVFEATFVHKILSRKSWLLSFCLAISQLILILVCKNALMSNIINLLYYFVPHIIIRRKWITLLESAFMYLLIFIYSALFLVGRIGYIDGNQGYNFIFNVLGAIDYKLFIVSIYLFIKNFGGIKLWKNLTIFV